MTVCGGYGRYVAVIEGMWRLLEVCGGYNRYLAVIIGMWRLYGYVAVM